VQGGVEFFFQFTHEKPLYSLKAFDISKDWTDRVDRICAWKSISEAAF